MRRDVFQAIADPTRRAIISLIAFQPMTPNALADHFDSSRQAVSKHIQILAACDLIKQEQSGREIYYELNLKKLKEVDKWLDSFAYRFQFSWWMHAVPIAIIFLLAFFAISWQSLRAALANPVEALREE